MKKLLILCLLTGCMVKIKHTGLDNVVPKKIETDSDIEAGPNFDEVKTYCEGKVEHEIDAELRADPSFVISDEEKQYQIEDCYYSFDLDVLN